ncbi:aado keto reductase [Moniliophthora roreri MCA 2997]|uniref:Aado keto reductase n=1 Tax=Moniliophthora roreri (strain MCA 2997) TaxID=1381753 RepID=V2YIP9_MONRO|nr:aado keto reductase [Moniliophthora roreri MCA 2997]
MAPQIPLVSLKDGRKIPAIGMGCWIGTPGGGQRVYDYCSKAIKVGYRHFDTASDPGNEAQVGKAIRDSGIPREEFFVTTKLGNGDHGRVSEAFEESFKNLDIDYVDLYLIHWPQAIKPSEAIPPDQSPTFVETWKNMEKLLDTNKVKSIGVSNFSVKNLGILLPHCTIVPATNQIEAHPYLPNHELKAYCDGKGIPLTAYSPIGQPRSDVPLGLLENPTIRNIADKFKVDTAQVLISWAIQRGTIAIPKTENEGRMVTNITLITLPDEDMEVINNIHRNPGMHRSLINGVHNEDGKAFGWTYEQLGWNMTTGGIVPQ